MIKAQDINLLVKKIQLFESGREELEEGVFEWESQGLIQNNEGIWLEEFLIWFDGKEHVIYVEIDEENKLDEDDIFAGIFCKTLFS